MKTILIATTNLGKMEEFQFLFSTLPFKVVSLRDFPKIEAPKETGETFEENAKIKANFYFNHFKIPVIVEDSGFCVEKLGNLPGVHSADWGKNGDFSEGIAKVYKMLKGAPSKACFISVIIFKTVEKEILSTGLVEGLIAKEAKGLNGFGFDPCFIPNSATKTFGEMKLDEKSAFSHRSIAMQNLLKQL